MQELQLAIQAVKQQTVEVSGMAAGWMLVLLQQTISEDEAWKGQQPASQEVSTQS